MADHVIENEKKENLQYDTLVPPTAKEVTQLINPMISVACVHKMFFHTPFTF